MNKKVRLLVLYFALFVSFACVRSATSLESSHDTKSAAEVNQPALTSSFQKPIQITCLVTTGIHSGKLNVRSCPGTYCGVVGILSEGDRVTVQETKDGWRSIAFGYGKYGFVRDTFCGIE